MLGLCLEYRNSSALGVGGYAQQCRSYAQQFVSVNFVNIFLSPVSRNAKCFKMKH